MRILFLSHTAMGGPFVVGSHHLSRAMARLGHRVAHLSPPVTPAHAIHLRDPFERRRIARWLAGGELVHGVLDLVPFSPLPWPLARRLSAAPHLLFGRLARFSALRRLRRCGLLAPELVLIDEPRLCALLPAFPAARVIYRPTDLYAEIRNDASIRLAEAELVRRADGFIATSEPVAAHLRALGAADVLLMENGVDVEHFLDGVAECAEPDLRHDGPVAIYAGAFDRRFGREHLLRAAEAHPQVLFALIGPADAAFRAHFEASENVRFLGPVAFDELPGYFRRASVGLLPLSDHPSNAGRSPMKLYEYAAAGLPVVASHTPELARRRLPFVRLAGSPGEFARCVGEALREAGPTEEGLAIARSQSWRAKCEQVLGFAWGEGAKAL